MPIVPQTEESIFAAAIEKPSLAQRAAFLDAACGGDANLRARIERLLKSHSGAGSFLAKPIAATVDPSPIERPGTVIGPYKLREQIGEGGFGIVFVAEQEKPVRRKVALKIIKPGMDTKDVIARFEAERQALALMDHPHVARVLDAGSTESGRPYFVMELVHGVPITEFCDKNKLPTRDRLALFADVCRAVQHAHQKGIIHRDLKPSNIMVTLHDGKPVAKVIDFGVSKALSQQLTEKSIYTAYGQMIGTPSYMSPEQAEMSGLGIDTRSDIYSLGVLLYELLTGTTPLDAKRLRASAYADILRIIKEEEPPRPSLKISTLGEEATVIAEHRHTDPQQLRRDLSGELDWIVMKCLDKDRARRYETASGLARDIERYLHDEPVEACPPSLAYRFHKLARKHRALLTTVASIAALLLISAVVSASLAAWAMRAQRESEAALASERLARQEAVAAKERADQAAMRLGMATQVASDGIEYYNRHNWSSAHEQFARAIQIEPGLNTPYIYRGALYANLGLWDKAPADYDRRFQLAKRASAETWRDYLVLKAYTGDESGYRTACQEMLRQHKNSADIQSRQLVIHSCLLTSQPAGDASELCEMAESLVAAANVPWHYGIAGRAHLLAGDFKKAEARGREAIQLGAPSPNGIHRMNHANLALALQEQGKTPEAKEALDVASQAKDEWTAAMQQSLVGAMPIEWNTWLEFLLLHRQATLRITLSPPADDPRLTALYERALATVTYGDVFTFMDTGREHVQRHEWAEAADSFVQVLDKLPAGFRSSSQEMRFCIEIVQRPEVFERLTKLRPENHRLWIIRGRNHASSSEWTKAAADYKKALDLMTPTSSLASADRGPWYGWGVANHELGAVLLLSGDEAGYQRLCQAVLESSAPLDDHFVCSILSRTCTMTADAVADFSIPLRAAQYAVEKQPGTAWYLYALGIAQHRMGKHEEAVQSLKRSIAVNETWVGRGQNYATLALACHSLGRDEEARQWLGQTRSWLKDTNYQAASWTFGYAATDYLSDWLGAQVLLREAEKLLAHDQQP